MGFVVQDHVTLSELDEYFHSILAFGIAVLFVRLTPRVMPCVDHRAGLQEFCRVLIGQNVHLVPTEQLLPLLGYLRRPELQYNHNSMI